LRLGLLGAGHLAVGRWAVVFLPLASQPTLPLAAVQGLALNAQHERALLLDFSVFAFVLPLL
jgi:hypothetical protein